MFPMPSQPLPPDCPPLGVPVLAKFPVASVKGGPENPVHKILNTQKGFCVSPEYPTQQKDPGKDESHGIDVLWLFPPVLPLTSSLALGELPQFPHL